MAKQLNIKEIVDSLIKSGAIINICCGTYIGETKTKCNRILINNKWIEWNEINKLTNYHKLSGDICPECYKRYMNSEQ